MNHQRIVVEDIVAREYVDSLIQIRDRVRIAWSLDDHYCQACDYSIGMDDDMWEEEGCVVHVDKISDEFNPTCGAKVFVSDSWIWSTCWIDRFLPTEPPRQTWAI